MRLEQHPDAAKVQRVYVDAGDGAERHVWCGAFNMQPDDIVPLATLGTTMPDGRTIERRGILGIDSEGMLCSSRELGLGDDHSGIAILPAGTPLGVPYGEALGLRPDVLIDADVTRNRPDCWGYVGIARDLAAKLGVEFRPPRGNVGRRRPSADQRRHRRRDTLRSIHGDGHLGHRGHRLADWMARRLTAAGMRPINNVVDVSNYVMLELDQPNHAYDLTTLAGGFRVRTADDGERITTLDGQERVLTEADLLVCNGEDRPVGGLAGVMGGLDTEIGDDTSVVALEVAWFEPIGIGRTVARHGLRSEASARFDRGVDPYGMPLAIARFAELLSETCPALTVHAGAADARAESLPAEQRSADVRISEVNRILGTDLAADDLPPLLDPIGYTVTGTGDVRTVALPTWRPDSTAEIDVIEEVARHYGYERLGKTVPKSVVHGGLSVRQQRRRLVREVLLGLGISEAMPNPFLGPDTLQLAGLPADALRVTNPLVSDESVLRTSLRPGLLRAVAYNESHRRSGVRLFEIGHVYPPGDGELPNEYESLAVVLAGAEAPDTIAVWRELAAALGAGARHRSIEGSRRHASDAVGRSPGRRRPLGGVGEVHPAVLARFDVTERIAILEIDLDQVLDREPKPTQWKATSRYPSSDLDLAFVVPETVPAERVDKAIRQGAGNLLVEATLFDVYRGDRVPDGTRSLAYRLRLQAQDRNLTDGDIAGVRHGVGAAATKLGADLRS